jgi:hypothetical protein
MSDKLIPIAVAELHATHVIKSEAPLEDRCRAAMKATYRHWVLSEEEDQFKAAVVAVYTATEDEGERERIKSEVDALAGLSVLLGGVVPVDIERLSAMMPENPIGLKAMWMEVTRRG